MIDVSTRRAIFSGNNFTCFVLDGEWALERLKCFFFFGFSTSITPK